MTTNTEPRTVETWKTVQIDLASEHDQPDPMGIEVDAVFTSDRGEVIRRPAFWDGGRTWRVRFAPIAAGEWTMVTSSSVPDVGLDGVNILISSVPYSGDLDIYKRGFIRVAESGRHFEYADSTPFFYLGDTHWILPHERFDSSNAPGADSQFQYMVDLRVEQGFTVYQSEPIWQPHVEPGAHPDRDDEEAVANLTDGFDESDLAGFANLDRKFDYIAEQGLVHANAQITWVLDPADHPDVFTEQFMFRMARYWVARYGSYPVIWTIGQEIDPTMYGRYPAESMEVWFAVARAIEQNDPYHQVIMPHMENTASATASQSTWSPHSFHHAFGAQIDTWNSSAAREFWEQTPPKPAVVYETRYDGFWADDEEALAAGYRAFQLGFFGYGYGATGIWNDVYSRPGEELDVGTDYELPERYAWWFDGTAKPAAAQLGFFRQFYEALPWWRLEPRFGDPTWSLLNDGDFLATISREVYVVFLAHPSTLGTNGVVRGLDDVPYSASWFDPRTGVSADVSTGAGAEFTPETGEWRLPAAPSAQFWVFLIRRLDL